MPTFRWEEIQKHNLRTDRWLVIDRKVYNVTKWSQRHPGGHRVIGHYSGEDATVRVWGYQPLLSAAGWCQEPGVPGRQTDLRFLMERRMSNRERKCTYCSHLAPGIVLLWVSWADLGRAFWTPGLSTSVEVPSVANCPVHVHSACCALVQREPGTLQRGRSGLRVWRSPSGRWPPLGTTERSLRAGSHMWDPPARPGGGEGELVPGQDSLLLGLLSEKVHNGCPTETA